MIKLIRLTILSLSLFPCLSYEALAAPQFDIQTPQERLSINEPFDLRITARWPKEEGAYRFGFSNLSLKNLDLIKQGESQEAFFENGEEYLERSFVITLRPQSKGEVEVEGFTIHYLDPATQKGGAYDVAPFTSKAGGSVKLLLWIMALTSIGILLVSIFALFIFNSRKRKKTQSLKRTLTVEEQVVRQLEKLIDERSKKPQKLQLSDWNRFLRKFVVDYYGFENLNMREDELSNALKSKGASSSDQKKVIDLFNKLGEAKFSGVEIPENQFNALRDEITDFVRNRNMVRS